MGGVGPLSFRAWKDGGAPRGGKGSLRVAETVTGERDREAAPADADRGRNRRQMGERLSREEIMEAQWQMGRGARSEEDKRHPWR